MGSLLISSISIVDRLTGVVVWQKKDEMEEMQFTPQGLGYKAEGLIEVIHI